MSKRIFSVLCFVMVNILHINAGEPSIKISLGIHDNKSREFANKADLLLAFEMKNTGSSVIPVATLPFKGSICILRRGEKNFESKYLENWQPKDPELSPGTTSESPAYGDLFTFFPSIKDGTYLVWWTLEDSKMTVHFKSNVVLLTVDNGKLVRFRIMPRQATGPGTE